MNVRINLSSLKDEKAKSALQEKMDRLSRESEAAFSNGATDRRKQVVRRSS